jgi:transcriptional regulator with XRE-family HTH domain
VKKFGTHLRELRHARGLSLEATADQAGIRKGYLSGIEPGSTSARFAARGPQRPSIQGVLGRRRCCPQIDGVFIYLS